MALKTDLLNGRLIYRENTHPESWFWLIRHFLGLLPIPLFPKYSNGHKFDWEYMAMKCKLYGHKSELDFDIAWRLMMLPESHIIMAHSLINFLRLVAKKIDRKVNKRNALILTKYFSSTLFIRPYRLENNTEVLTFLYKIYFKQKLSE